MEEIMADFIDVLANIVEYSAETGKFLSKILESIPPNYLEKQDKDKQQIMNLQIPEKLEVPKDYITIEEFKIKYAKEYQQNINKSCEFEWDKNSGKIKCSEWLIAALGTGALITVGGIVYICAPYIESWLKAYKGN